VRASNRAVGTELPKVDAAALSVFLSVAVVLAVPGAATQVAEGWEQARERARFLGVSVRKGMLRRVRNT